MNDRLRVFIYNGYGIFGGSFMLYSIGSICYTELNAEVFIVQNHYKKRGESRFHYSYDFPTINVKEMETMMTSHDVFFCNPAHSALSFGSRLPAQKVMYLQGVNTYSSLDKNFDHYVSVSNFVREYTKQHHQTDSQIISPFINLDLHKNNFPWDKKRNSILVLGYKKESEMLFRKLLNIFNQKYPNHSLSFNVVKDISQLELAKLMQEHKYYLTLSPIEGFGLPPLEAMASGCAVFGFDGCGGKDYFTASNSFVSEENCFEPLTDFMKRIEVDPNVGKGLAENALITAQAYSFEKFKDNWTRFLMENVLKK